MNDKIDEFINTVMKLAAGIQLIYILPAAAITAQACLETGFGKFVKQNSETGKNSYNLFNIKGIGSNGSVRAKVYEVHNGEKVLVEADFKAYHSYYESMQDYAAFIKGNKRYERAVAAGNDPDKYIDELHKAGYATDPKYPEKLKSIMDRFALHEKALEMIKEAGHMDGKVEPWKEQIMQEALKQGIITSNHHPDDPAPKWFVLAVALNVLKLLGK